MMNLQSAVVLSTLRSEALPVRKQKTRAEMCVGLKGVVDGDPRRWVSSEEFYLLPVPIHAVSIPGASTNPRRVVAVIDAAAASTPFVVVDMNKRRLGGSVAGFVPPVIVLAGLEAARRARAEGREKVWAWVGSLAAKRLKLLHADHQFGAQELRDALQKALGEAYGEEPELNQLAKTPWIREVYPLENYVVFDWEGKQWKQTYTADAKDRSVELTGEPSQVVQKYMPVGGQTKLAAAVSLYAPPPVRVEPQRPVTPTLRTKKAKKKMSSAGYKGYEKATPEQRQKTKGARQSEMTSRLMGKARIDKIVTDYKAACKAGYKPKMEAKAPEGCEHVVQSLKKSKSVDNPWAVANWMKEQGRC